ncbi:hypothetical protein AH06_291 [Erwinia phage AH06]|nr:hypothetical protein AH06_291 [Erwinia phage AH06]
MNKEFDIVLDTRGDLAGMYQLLVARINTLLRAGVLYHEVAITQWSLYHKGLLVKGGDTIHASLLRHFYHDVTTNTFGGGFMTFEIFDDIERYYQVDDLYAGYNMDDLELSITVTVTAP